MHVTGYRVWVEGLRNQRGGGFIYLFIFLLGRVDIGSQGGIQN